MGVERTTRLNALLQRELGQIIERCCRNASVSALVTVTGVEVSSNLRNANVFVSIYGAKNAQEQVMALLSHQRSPIQSALAAKVIMKYTPVLNFKLDNTAERADRVMAILKDLNMDDAKPANDNPPEN